MDIQHNLSELSCKSVMKAVKRFRDNPQTGKRVLREALTFSYEAGPSSTSIEIPYNAEIQFFVKSHFRATPNPNAFMISYDDPITDKEVQLTFRCSEIIIDDGKNKLTAWAMTVHVRKLKNTLPRELRQVNIPLNSFGTQFGSGTHHTPS